MIKNVLVVEDNEIHMKALERLLSKIQNLKIVKAYNMAEACYMLSLYEYSLFLIDIVLDKSKRGDLSGIHLVNYIRELSKYQFTPVIFITSLEDPKLSAFKELHCYDYIEKPFSEKQVVDVVEQALKFPVQRSNNEFLYLKKEGIIYSFDLTKVKYITVSRRGMEIHSVDEVMHMPYASIDGIIKELGNDDFIQCNRNTVVNKRYIDTIDMTNKILRLKDEDEFISIGKMMKKELL